MSRKKLTGTLKNPVKVKSLTQGSYYGIFIPIAPGKMELSSSLKKDGKGKTILKDGKKIYESNPLYATTPKFENTEGVAAHLSTEQLEMRLDIMENGVKKSEPIWVKRNNLTIPTQLCRQKWSKQKTQRNEVDIDFDL